MIDGRTPDAKLGKSDHNNRHHDDGRVDPETGGSQDPRKHNPDQQVADGHRQITAKYAQDILEKWSFSHTGV